jgi:hypothetical protein
LSLIEDEARAGWARLAGRAAVDDPSRFVPPSPSPGTAAVVDASRISDWVLLLVREVLPVRPRSMAALLGSSIGRNS